MDEIFLTYSFKKPEYIKPKEFENDVFSDFIDITNPTQQIPHLTQDIQNEVVEEPAEEDSKKEKSKEKSLPIIPAGPLTNDRKKLLDEMKRLNFSQEEINYYDKLAGRESSWRNIKGTDAGKGRSARGYFQFLDSTLKGLGINKKANEMNLTEQLLAIKKFTDANRSALSGYLDIAKAKGISEYGLLAGAHLGGVGGVKRYFTQQSDAADRFGTKISDYMKYFS